MIHAYKQNGYNIILDVHSGSVHSVDDVAFDVIRAYETLPRAALTAETMAAHPEVTEAELEELYEDIEALRAAGKLFAPDTYAEIASARKGTEIKALCLHVSHTCNLTCDYCFASQGKYQGDRALMSAEVGRRAIDFLIEGSGARRNLEVDFFGGEPLMNWDVVKEIVRYAREIEGAHGKNFRFTLTTNGMLLDDDVMEFANREMHNVVLSLDGRKEIHDALRRTPGGGGSYDEIVPRFQELVRRRGGQGYYIRGTFTHGNTDFTEDVLHMADLGFTELSMEPVVAAPGDSCALTEADLPVLMDQYERLADEMLRREAAGRGFTFYHYMIDLGRGPCIYKRIAGCGSGTEYFAVTPWGELFPCHQFVGDAAYSMGDIWQGVTNGEKREDFARCNIYARPECRECWARLYCSGGCAANAYHAEGSILGVYEYGCTLFKKRMECAIYMKVAQAKRPIQGE